LAFSAAVIFGVKIAPEQCCAFVLRKHCDKLRETVGKFLALEQMRGRSSNMTASSRAMHK
jgi:hypothetical protein